MLLVNMRRKLKDGIDVASLTAFLSGTDGPNMLEHDWIYKE